MENDEGNNVELYFPRKCTASNRIIGAKDHASVQINIGHVDQHGIYTGDYTTIAFAGFLRNMAQSDSALNRLAADAGLMKNITNFAPEHRFKGDE